MSTPHSDKENPAAALLEEALRLKDTKERQQYLEQACGEDESLLAEVKSLLGYADLWDDFAAKATDFVGKIVGKYELKSQIGRGGMGTVYLGVRTENFKQHVAVKIINRDVLSSSEGVRRFKKEMQIMARLNHPNLARLIDAGTTDDGFPYVIMEYVDGERLDTYCDKNKLTIRERLSLFQKVCAVVSFTHDNEIVHRDIKPSNILVAAEGEPKLIDFGIAKVLNSTYDTRTLDHSAPLLSLDYGSPEQIRGDRIIGKQSDIYSLGAVLYELLTGCRAHRFKDETYEELRRVVCDVPVVRPSQVIFDGDNASPAEQQRTPVTASSASAARGCQPKQLRRQLAGDLDSIILKTLCKEARHRYQSVEALAADLDNHLNRRSVAARRGAWWRKFTSLIEKIGNNLPPTGFGLKPKAAIYTLLVIAALIVWQIPRETPTPQPASGARTGLPPLPLPALKTGSMGAALSSDEQGNVKQGIAVLSRNLGSGLNDTSIVQPWELAQMLVSAEGMTDLNEGKVLGTVSDLAKENFCKWREKAHIAATGWVVLASLRSKSSSTSDQEKLEKRVDYILSKQNQGWWPLYPSQPDSARSPSTYATAYAVLALHEYLKSEPTTSQEKRISSAIRKGQTWLLNSHIPNEASWKDGPDNPGGAPSVGLSGLVMHVLHRTLANTGELSELAKLWRQHLPVLDPNPAYIYSSRVYFGKNLIEDTNNLAMPWAIIATADTYAGGTEAEKKAADEWMKKALDHINDNFLNREDSILNKLNYCKAELLISLRYLMDDEII
ncbi:MAG TPA: protein kinase [Pyrinomonadaceae bacterium]|jgi:serine/threonine protein kinase|nr:protein kinase [Pyrinomonadaceae bacterium]